MEHLQVVWCNLLLTVFFNGQDELDMPTHRFASILQEVAERLLQLQPEHPRSSFEASRVRAACLFVLNCGCATISVLFLV